MARARAVSRSEPPGPRIVHRSGGSRPSTREVLGPHQGIVTPGPQVSVLGLAHCVDDFALVSDVGDWTASNHGDSGL